MKSFSLDIRFQFDTSGPGKSIASFLALCHDSSSLSWIGCIIVGSFLCCTLKLDVVLTSCVLSALHTFSFIHSPLPPLSPLPPFLPMGMPLRHSALSHLVPSILFYFFSFFSSSSPLFTLISNPLTSIRLSLGSGPTAVTTGTKN